MIGLLEPRSPLALALGLGYFALLTGAGLAVGLGLLALLRFPTDPTRRLLLAPFAATMVWTLAANLLVRSGFTLAQATPPVAIASLGLAVLGIAWAARRRLPPRSLAVVVALGLVTGFVTWPDFARGLTAHLGSPNPDTVHYTSTATTLWRYGLDASSAPFPFFQRFARTAEGLALGRNHTFVLLGLLSPLVEAGEPAFIRNLFVCWSIFVLAASLGFYRAGWDGSEGREASSWEILLYVLVTAGIGWAVVPTLVGNWDNGLLVPVGPVLAGLAAEAPIGPGYAILLGATAAYAGYTYPELAPFLALFLPPLYVRALRPASWMPTLRAGILAGFTAVALLLPGAMALTRYVLGQLDRARVPGPRPGGGFAEGLVSAPLDPSAWWVLGAEHGGTPGRWGWLCALALTALALAGLVSLARRRRWPEVTALGLVGASLAYYVLVDRYGYAAYKVVSVAWWLVGRCLVEGCGALVTATPAGRTRRRLAVGALATVLLTSLLVAERRRAWVFFDAKTFRRQPTLAALSRLRAAAASQPAMDVLVTGPSLDHLTLPWILYALKDTPLRPYNRATLNLLPFPAQATLPPGGPAPGGALFLARDLPPVSPRFRTPEFALTDFTAIHVVDRIDNPNGLEAWGSWLGTRPITVSLLAGPGLALTLSFEATPGPSLPGTPRRVILLRSGAREVGRVEIDGRATVVFPFTTAGGREVLTLSTPQASTVLRLPNGDTRPLLVGIRNLRVGLASDGPTPRSR